MSTEQQLGERAIVIGASMGGQVIAAGDARLHAIVLEMLQSEAD